MMTQRASTRIVFFGMSDCGLQRQNNEDHFIVADLTRKMIGVEDNRIQTDLLHHEVGEHGTLLAVADGLGGHECGEIASLLAVDTLAQSLFESPLTLPLPEQLMQAVLYAHEAILKHHSSGGHQRRMASTLTAIHVGSRQLTIAQVGDSRAYRFGDGQLTLLTEDQTVVRMMQKKGLLTEEEVQHHPHRNVILQALGQDKTVTPEIQTLPIQDGDCFLLCSDGLTSYVSHERIEKILLEEQDEHARCRRLIDAANAAGGGDNITVLLARVIVPPGMEGEDAAPRRASGEHQVPETKKKSLWTTEIKLPWGGRDTPSEEPEAVGESGKSSWATALRVSWFQKSGKEQETATADSTAAPVLGDDNPETSIPAKPSIWQREIKWRWGQKSTTSPQELAELPPLPAPMEAEGKVPFEDPLLKPVAGKSSLLRFREKKGVAPMAVWNPQVLKFLEDQLARYVGPVAKILVGRAASQTDDVHALCQTLVAQLASEQEQRNFLRAVAELMAHHKK